MTFMEWLEGKKTYITAIVAALLGIAQAFGVMIPEFVYVILAALGITTLRAGIKSEVSKMAQ